MSRLLSRKPSVGIVAGLIFAALGMLLLGIEGSRALATVLFTVSAWFFLFIGAVSILSGVAAFLRRRRGP